MGSDDKRIISFPECRKMHSLESKFSRLSVGECPHTPPPPPSSLGLWPLPFGVPAYFPSNALQLSELMKPLLLHAFVSTRGLRAFTWGADCLVDTKFSCLGHFERSCTLHGRIPYQIWIFFSGNPSLKS